MLFSFECEGVTVFRDCGQLGGTNGLVTNKFSVTNHHQTDDNDDDDANDETLLFIEVHF